MAKTVDDILIPMPKHRRPPVKRSGKGFLRFLLGLGLLFLVLAGIFSIADIGGNIILGFAKSYLSENMGLELTADSITGNPVKGYRLNNFELADKDGRKILAAGYLAGRVNFGALLTGKVRLAEISLGGMSMDIDTLIATVQNLKLPETEPQASLSLYATPAFADTDNPMPDIPLDRFSLRESRFTSEYGVITVNEIGADLRKFDVDIDAGINGIPLRGTVDMGEAAGLTGINRSDLSFGSAKILATGGLVGENLDLHASIENVDLQEMTGLYPELLKSGDFAGTASINADITGRTDSPRAFGTIDYKGTKIYGFPVERASANFNYADYRAGLSNIQASVFNVPIQGEIAAAVRPNEKLSVMVKLDGSEASLDGLDKVLGLEELKGLSGKVEAFNANISGYVDKLNGLVNFTAPRVAYAGRAFTNIRAQMKLSQSDTANVDGKFTFEGAQGYIQGQVASLLVNPNMNITAKIVDLDIKRVENMIPDASDYKLAGKITASVNVKGTASSPKISGSLNSPEFSGFDQTITKPVINFAFADKTLTLSKTEGTLNGMPINVNGTISPLPSDNPNLDISATISMTPAALKAYVPDIDSYKLKGNVHAGVRVRGSVNSPSVNLVASSPNLQAMDIVSAKDIELTTALAGDLAKLDKLSINAAAKSITASGVTFSGVSAKIDKNGDKITLGGLNAKSGKGTITGSGTADIAGKSPLDFNFRFTNLELAPLAAASGAELKGSLTGTLKVSGTNTSPNIALNANVPSLNAQGFTLTGVAADVAGTMESVKINRLRADVEGAEVSASGTVQVSPSIRPNITIKADGVNLARLLPDYDVSGTASLNFVMTGEGTNVTGKGSLGSPALKAYGISLSNVSLPLAYSGNSFTSNGGTAKFYGGNLKNSLTFNVDSMKFTDSFEASGVNLGGLVADVSKDMKDTITGTAALTLNLSGTGANVSGKGTLTLPAFKAYGFSLSSVNLPLSYSGNKFASSGGTAKLYGGTLKNTLTFDVNTMKFTDNIDASGVDVNALIQDASGGLEGKITGTGKLTMKVNGSAKDKVTYSGTGNFSMGAGAITGFKWLDIVAKVHGINGIRYATVNAPLSLQTGKLILKAGSIANAPKNDPMYRYAKLTQNGTIDFGGQEATLNFLTESVINYQLINALQGGGKGGLEALFKGGVSNLQDGLKAFLQGGLAGAEKTAATGDFRTVNLKISGKAASPSFSGLKIGPSTVKTQTPAQTQSTDKKQETTLQERIIDRTVDILLPGAKKPQQSTPITPKITTPADIKPKTQTKPQTQQKKSTRQQVEDRVKDELRKGLQKGLGGLLKR
ncbi:MAG: hypothetical protein IJT02_05290 [Synergistaceae bacterium]|nr:hypothetical protein [Synergistaceae bacterium]